MNRLKLTMFMANRENGIRVAIDPNAVMYHEDEGDTTLLVLYDKSHIRVMETFAQVNRQFSDIEYRRNVKPTRGGKK